MKNTLRILLSFLILHSAFFISRAAAQTTAQTADQSTGAIAGRVYLPSSDRYLENAHVVIEGTNRAALTDGIGAYILTDVPAGEVKVTASFIGFPPRTFTVNVAPGQTAMLDIDILLAPTPRPGTRDDDVVKLDAYVVNADRYETGSAIARNEQRYAIDMRAVVASDEFGENPTGNIGEFLKHLPGVSLVNVNGEARAISIDGANPNDVPITFAGFNLANTASGTKDRQVELDGVSISNAARMEITFAPTPEIEGRALAGSVNIVPRSAFEYKRPRFTLNTYLTFGGDSMTLNKTPGPWFTPARKAGPNVSFSYIVPVNEKFGFTVSAHRAFYSTADQLQRTYWRGSSDAHGVAHFPLTDVNNPYLSRIDLRQGSSVNERVGFSITADWRITRADRLSFALQYGVQDIHLGNRNLIVAIQHFDPDVANILSPYYAEGGGYTRQTYDVRRKSNTTYMPTLTWRHNGPKWKMNAGLAYSRASHHNNDTPYGFFNSAYADRGNLKIIFDDMHYTGPRSITATDLGTGATIDPYTLDGASITNVFSRGTDAYAKSTNGYFDIQRDLRLGNAPFLIKAGYNYLQAKRGTTTSRYTDWTYLGPDGRASGPGNDGTTGIMLPPASNDDSAKLFSDKSASSVPVGFGHPNVEWVDLAKLYQMYEANPGYFANQPSDEPILALWDASETIHSAYLRADLYVFNNRLKIIGGLRMEHTDVDGRAPLRTNIGGRQKWVAYGAHSNVNYTNWFPRVNLVWDISQNLIFRAAYYESIRRPLYTQYADRLIVPDLTSEGSTSNRFQLSNPLLEPATSRTFSAGVEYYFKHKGSLSARVFSRKINKFTIDTIEPISEDVLLAFGLNPNDYIDYDVVTSKNSAKPATVNGIVFEYRQALSFLPPWAQGLNIYANASFQSVSGPGQENLIDGEGSYRPQLYKASINYARKRISLRATYNYMARAKTGLNTSTNVPVGTYTWLLERQSIDLSGEYRLKNWTLYFVIENLTGEPMRNYEIYGPDTPQIARMRYMEDFDPKYTFGIKTVF